MPLKEFDCLKCENKRFTLLIPKDKEICPKCKSKELKPLFSVHATSTTWNPFDSMGWSNGVDKTK